MCPIREVYHRLISQRLASYTHYALESENVIRLQHLGWNMGPVTLGGCNDGAIVAHMSY